MLAAIVLLERVFDPSIVHRILDNLLDVLRINPRRLLLANHVLNRAVINPVPEFVNVELAVTEQLLHINVLAAGWPVRRTSSLKAVVDELDAGFVNGSPLTERAQTGLEQASIAVEPLEYLTHFEDGKEWIHAIVIENPFRTGDLHTETPRVAEPQQAVMHLTSHELQDEAPSSRYQLEEYAITDEDIVNLTLSGSWSRST